MSSKHKALPAERKALVSKAAFRAMELALRGARSTADADARTTFQNLAEYASDILTLCSVDVLVPGDLHQMEG